MTAPTAADASSVRAARTPSTPEASTTRSRSPANAGDGGAHGRRVGLDQAHTHRVAVQRGLELLGRALHDRAPAVDEQQFVGEPIGLFHVVRGEHDGEGLLAREPPDLRPHRGPRLGIESRGRLVEEQHARAVHERGRDIEPAPHASGERADATPGCLGQAELIEQSPRSRTCLDGVHAAHAAGDLEVLAGGEHRVGARPLRDVADRRHARRRTRGARRARRPAPCRRWASRAW